jgi:UDP-N-acetyl-2-amino-2-deoxyglucuronate dehydrogenase
LAEIEKETGRKIHTILQLRLHPTIIALRDHVKQSPQDKIFDVNLAYVTSRGRWYHISWKGDISKSGGIATNIGIHFFDMLIWVFGAVKTLRVTIKSNSTIAGVLELERARVQWHLSIDYNELPDNIKTSGKRTYRSITLDGEEMEFSEGFTDLHTASYRAILDNGGFDLVDSRPAIELAYRIRSFEMNK